jgi:ankyrin repeat protein
LPHLNFTYLQSINFFQLTENIINILDYLHSKGGDLEAPNQDGKTPLYYAAEAGEFEVVKYLVSKKVGCLTIVILTIEL